MNLKSRLTGNLRRGTTVAVLTIIAGLVLSTLRIGEGLVHRSYDLPFVFGSVAIPDDIIIVKMDEGSNVALKQASTLWNRRIHAQLLDKLTKGRSKMAVFDVVFADPGDPAGNAELARAIKAHAEAVERELLDSQREDAALVGAAREAIDRERAPAQPTEALPRQAE